MTPIFEDLGRRIKTMREAKGLNLVQFAEAVGVRHPTVIAWENGKTENIKHKNLLAIANFFNITLEELLTGRADKEVKEPRQKYSSNSYAENEALRLFRRLPQRDRQVVLLLMETLSAASKKSA